MPSLLLIHSHNKQQLINTLHSKPSAGHSVEQRNSLDMVSALKELTTWQGNTESSIHHAFAQLTLIENLLYEGCPEKT